jgi:hypothetical protein
MAGLGGGGTSVVSTSSKKVDYASMGKSLKADIANAYKGEGGSPDITPNPYTYQVGHQVEEGAFDNQYSGFNKQLASKLMGLGNTDFSGEINRMAQKGIDSEETRAQAKYNSLGMGEMALRGDLQDEWSERRTDASSRARMTGAELKRSALATAVQGIQSMSGTDLNHSIAKINALLGAGNQWQDYQKMLMPLMEKMGAGGGSEDTELGGRSMGGRRR